MSAISLSLLLNLSLSYYPTPWTSSSNTKLSGCRHFFMRFRQINSLPCENSNLVMENKSRLRTQTKGVVIHPHISFSGFSHHNKPHFQGPTDSLLAPPLETFRQFSLSFSLSLPTLKARTLMM